jgi:hypothetical protein
MRERSPPHFGPRWRTKRRRIPRDLLEIEAIRDIQAVETLVELLRHRVGSPISYASLARDLQRDPKTIKRWLTALENLYVVFRVAPFHRNIARSLLKEPKYYFYDVAQVQNGDGARLENLVACALYKETHRLQDEEGERVALHYLRTKDGREVDFVVIDGQRPKLMIEVKSSESEPSNHLAHFRAQLPKVRAVQLVRQLKREFTDPNGIEVRRLTPWLTLSG